MQKSVISKFLYEWSSAVEEKHAETYSQCHCEAVKHILIKPSTAERVRFARYRKLNLC
jgi:hypothetical protein